MTYKFMKHCIFFRKKRKKMQWPRNPIHNSSKTLKSRHNFEQKEGGRGKQTLGKDKKEDSENRRDRQVSRWKDCKNVSTLGGYTGSAPSTGPRDNPGKPANPNQRPALCLCKKSEKTLGAAPNAWLTAKHSWEVQALTPLQGSSS